MVLARKDSRLIDAQRLAELEERAQDGIDMRAALRAMQPKHYEMMAVVRLADQPGALQAQAHYADGWLGFENELGDQLAVIARRRAGTPKPTDPVDDEVPF